MSSSQQEELKESMGLFSIDELTVTSSDLCSLAFIEQIFVVKFGLLLGLDCQKFFS